MTAGNVVRWSMSTGAIAIALFAAAGAATAQSTEQCAALAGADKVACLRKALAETEAALDRAERELGRAEKPRAASPAKPAIPAAVRASADTIGAEQAARRAGIAPTSEDADRVSATIVAAQRVHPNRLRLELENGQVWRQVQADTQIVELPANDRVAAEIWQSGFGGYRMHLPAFDRVLKVERLR